MRGWEIEERHRRKEEKERSETETKVNRKEKEEWTGALVVLEPPRGPDGGGAKRKGKKRKERRNGKGYRLVPRWPGRGRSETERK